MKISIIVPNLNYSEYLVQCLESIAAQTNPNLEVIMIDAGSTDGSQDIMQRYARAEPTRWKYFERRGESQIESIIWGMAQSTGEIQCWINSDDTYITKNALKDVADLFAAYFELDCVSLGGYYLDRKGHFTSKILLQTHPLFRQSYIRWRGGIVQPATFWKRAVFAKLGLDRSLRYSFDTKFFILACHRFNVLIDQTQMIAGYRLHGLNLSMGVKAKRIHELARLDREVNGLGARYFYLWFLARLVNVIDWLPGGCAAPIKKSVHWLNNLLSYLTVYRWPGI